MKVYLREKIWGVNSIFKSLNCYEKANYRDDTSSKRLLNSKENGNCCRTCKKGQGQVPNLNNEQ